MGITISNLATQLKIESQILIDLMTSTFKKEFSSESILNEVELKVIYDWTKKKPTSSSTNPTSIPSSSKEMEEKSKGYLNYVISKSDVIFIDTSSLLQESSINFLEKLDAVLKQHKKTLILPYKVYEELQKHFKNEKDKNLSKKAKNIMLSLKHYQDNQLLEIYGDNTLDNFADNVFQMQITRLRVHKTVLLITNDIKLGKDILLLNESQSVDGKPIFVQKVNRFGFLQKVVGDYENKGKPTRTPKPKIDESQKFKLATKIVMYNNEILGYHDAISENDLVYDGENNPIKLGKELGKGGEGSVFSTSDSKYVAKIYKKEKVTKEKIDKLQLMISKSIDYDGICYPKTILYNHNKEFVGYLMPKAEGKELRHFLFIPKKVFEMRNPDWKRIDLIKLCLTILDKFAYLHERNIILGDINPFNILVVSAEKVYLVDVDSYQVEGFPCPVGTVNYTAPEIQGQNYKDFLRTFGNEYFAVATLLFNILFLGKSPYSQTGGESDTSNIRAMDFPYTFKREERADNTPKGQWRFIWSNLPYSVKKAFYETFQKGEPSSTEETRMNIQQWQRIFRKYYQELSSGKLIQQDEIANEIFPNRFKVIGDGKDKLKPCRICKQSFYEISLNKGICKGCLNKGEDYDCAYCGKELIFTNFEKYVRNLSSPYKYCKDCNSHLNTTFKRISCSTCTDVFSLTYKDKEFYDSKGFDYPKRCPSCRKNNNYNTGQTYTQTNNTTDSFTYNRKNPQSPPNKKSSWCYLTTVACEYYELPDDCYELETLRYYRDEWLANQTYGPTVIEEYYITAPLIVKALKESENYEKTCEWLMHDVIKNCIEKIESNQMVECFNIYKEMVSILKNKYFGDDILWKKIN